MCESSDKRRRACRTPGSVRFRAGVLLVGFTQTTADCRFIQSSNSHNGIQHAATELFVKGGRDIEDLDMRQPIRWRW